MFQQNDRHSPVCNCTSWMRHLAQASDAQLRIAESILAMVAMIPCSSPEPVITTRTRLRSSGRAFARPVGDAPESRRPRKRVSVERPVVADIVADVSASPQLLSLDCFIRFASDGRQLSGRRRSSMRPITAGSVWLAAINAGADVVVRGGRHVTAAAGRVAPIAAGIPAAAAGIPENS